MEVVYQILFYLKHLFFLDYNNFPRIGYLPPNQTVQIYTRKVFPSVSSVLHITFQKYCFDVLQKPSGSRF